MMAKLVDDNDNIKPDFTKKLRDPGPMFLESLIIETIKQQHQQMLDDMVKKMGKEIYKQEGSK